MVILTMKNNKVFLITIDTEADNQWDINHECSTINSMFLPRFQELAEKYGFKPTWLTTYEMANDENFVKYFKNKQDNGLCEIGMHLHAWNTPPFFKLETKTKERSYLIEYPINIMEEKIKNLDRLLMDKFKVKPISHRSGRWAINDEYLKLLSKYDYKIDCSVTPHINWSRALGETGMSGSNYTNYSEQAFSINDTIMEVPMSIRKIRCLDIKKIKSIKKLIREIQFLILGKKQWVRPDSSFSIKGIKKVIDKCNTNNEYVMFMIHSSELMPNGSPNFKSEDDIEKLYGIIEEIFRYVRELGYVGKTLREYYTDSGDRNE